MTARDLRREAVRLAVLGLRPLTPLYRRTAGRAVQRLFLLDLIEKTDNFDDVRWLGHPVWQNVLDLWTIQEVISELRPALLIETGTHRGGSALFYASLFDLLGHGRVITVDVERLHELAHPRIECLIGDSASDAVAERIAAAAAAAAGPVLVILDSDHSQAHVAAELERYAPLVTPGSYVLVQDGTVDTLTIFQHGRPGPLPAIDAFLAAHPEFAPDSARSSRFLVTHHPRGWLRRVS